MSNCIIAQSGGPTSVINSSVVGLIKANQELNLFENVYGGLNGIEGILDGNIVNLSTLSEEDLSLFQYTPSSGLGSCRYKLKNFTENPKEYEKLISILIKNNIDSFFYVGGNDSMDTVAKLSSYGKEHNVPIKFIGIPKTIDNDLMHTDHTPGFGSAAKFICTTALECYLDASVYTNNGIFILETMGRDTGWLAASATLARVNGKPIADFIYVPEVAFDKLQFLEDVRKRFNENNKVFIVVSEGIKDANGRFVSEFQCISNDSFGHAQLGGVSEYLRQTLLDAGITKRVKALQLGILQRCAMHSAAKIDIEEAYLAGYEALKYAKANLSGIMVSINRVSDKEYVTEFNPIEASKVANNVKYLPQEWINSSNNNLVESCYDYFLPLIGQNPTLNFENHLPKFKAFTI